MMTEDHILQLVRQDEWMMDVLRSVRSLNFDDWMVGAGFIRGKVWDHLHGYEKRSALPDVDVTYFDTRNLDEGVDEEYEHKLQVLMPDVPWSVGNAARLHVERGDPPYTSSTHSLEFWSETATATGLHLDAYDNLTLFVPFGIHDLVNLIVRPTPLFESERLYLYKERQRKKNWREKWPKLRFIQYP